jgi:hypothetical protein
MQNLLARLLKPPDEVKKPVAADWITAQLAISVVTLLFGVSLLLPPNQGLHYVLFDAFRKIGAIWGWGVAAIVGSLLHFLGYQTRRAWILSPSLVFCGAFWAFVAGCSLRQAWYFPSGWTCGVWVVVYLRSAYRVGFWTQ